MSSSTIAFRKRQGGNPENPGGASGNAAAESGEVLLKNTISKCVVCGKDAPAQVIRVNRDGRQQVVMRRKCAGHGQQEYVISTDARFYWLANGNTSGGSCGCGSTCSSAGDGGKEGTLGKNAREGTNQGVIERLSTCLALIEIVDSCNLACPTCFADSPVGAAGPKLKYHGYDNITGRIQGVIDRKGHIEIIQFSGGEPTIHPEFFELVEWVRKNSNIDYLVINTNGVRLANDPAFVERLAEMHRAYGNIQLYLQFDGPQENGQKELRGADLRNTRTRAIENCERIGLPITLAMTVTETNIGHVWDTVNYALKYEHIRGVSFQPMFLSGRNAQRDMHRQPITVADILLGLNGQSNGTVSLDDFTPLPCGDPNCATIGWLMRTGGKFYSPKQFGIDIAALQASLPDRVNYSIEDLAKCGCDNTPLGDLMKRLELKESNAFRLFIKPFMDSRSWDKHRTDRCCTHVIGRDGRLHSFCQYYAEPSTVAA